MTVRTKTPRAKSVKITTNEHGIDMIEIKTKPRSTFISKAKVLSILMTNQKPENITEIEKYGRTLYQVKNITNERTFTVGESKINAVLDNAKTITAKVAV